MGWVRISDDFYDHRKFVDVGALGIALWVTGMAHANRNLTDGYVSKSRARGLVDFSGLAYEVAGNEMAGIMEDDCAPLAVQLLLDAGLWHEDGHDCGHCPQPGRGYYYIHDYLVYQPSKEQVEETRAARTEAGRKGGQAKAKQVAKQSARQPAKQTPQQTASKIVPPIPSPKSQSHAQSHPLGTDENIHPVPETGDVDTDGLQHRARLYRFDPDRIRRELAKVLGEIPDDDTVMRVAVEILGRAVNPPEKPTGYLVTSIRNDEFGIQKLAYGGAA